MFDAVRRMDGKKMIVELSGQLDTPAASDFDEKVRPHLAKADEVVFDIKDLYYISSSGLRVFLSFKKNIDMSGGKMSIINTAPAVRSIFDVTGFTDILDIL